MDRGSLETLANARTGSKRALDQLLELRLLQEPQRGRYALHATVQYAIAKLLAFDEDAIALHYLELFEGTPARLSTDQSHLFALMDWAQEKRDLTIILRVHALAERLDERTEEHTEKHTEKHTDA